MKKGCIKTTNSRPSLKIALLWCSFFGMMASSCASDQSLHRSGQSEINKRTVLYSFTFVIHGDGEYLYHDTDGNEYRADEQILYKAKMVGLKNLNAEVFIFHQKSKEHFAFIFPRHDGEFLYYRNGQLITTEKYWRSQEGIYLHSEAERYRRFRVSGRNVQMNMFLYFGHEIPESETAGYDASTPGHVISVRDLSHGLQTFTADSSLFDIIILSTCFGGTPYTIGMLGSSARFIVASPDNLHLSYFVTDELERLDMTIHNGDLHAIAKIIAEQSFRSLTESIQTSVTVAVYDTDKTNKYIQSMFMFYDSLFVAEKKRINNTAVSVDNCDCAEISDFVFPEKENGVDVWYRPSAFGRLPKKLHHSGWECLRALNVRHIPAKE